LWKDFARTRPTGTNCGRIVERYCTRSSDGTKLLDNCSKFLQGLLRKIFLQFFHKYFPLPMSDEDPPNLSTILLQFFYNSSNFGRICCIWTVLEKNCRRNKRKRIVETFVKFRFLKRPNLTFYRFSPFLPTLK
jgi:hypothetical protein